MPHATVTRLVTHCETLQRGTNHTTKRNTTKRHHTVLYQRHFSCLKCGISIGISIIWLPFMN